MKRFIALSGLVVLVVAISSWAQMQAPKPDPEIKKFDAFLGHWTYTVEYKAGPLGPAAKASGEVTIKDILGGFFYENKVMEKGPSGDTQMLEIIGYDPANKTFTSNEFHGDGIVFTGTYTASGNTWTYLGKSTIGGKAIEAKNVLTLTDDRMSVLAKGELSVDGKTWVPWLEAKYTKTNLVP